MQISPKSGSFENFSLNGSLLEKEILKTIHGLGPKTLLRDACEYALCSGGKRIRPLICLAIAEVLGHKNIVLPAAVSVELFHTASLILDDLPSMDNESLRRNLPTLHCVYGESTALLASYTLIASAYEKIAESSKMANDQFPGQDLCIESLLAISRCAGIRGATQGQFYDLNPPEKSLENILKIIFYKTVTLFEIAFCLGWLLSGGEKGQMDRVIDCSHDFGYAFQVADDLKDIEQDSKDQKKLNIALFWGKESTQNFLAEKTDQCRTKLKKLGLLTPFFEDQLLSISTISYSATEAVSSFVETGAPLRTFS